MSEGDVDVLGPDGQGSASASASAPAPGVVSAAGDGAVVSGGGGGGGGGGDVASGGDGDGDGGAAGAGAGAAMVGPGSGSARVVDRDRRAPRFSWTPAYETTFFRSLCESVQLGLRENSSFKAEAWERAAQALQESHGASPTKSHLINKSDNARKRFRLWRGLREDPDFVYSHEAKTVTATEDAWAAHIEREPLSRALRGRPFEHEDFMEVLYPDVIGSGGAPKRIMKPRRRTDADDSDMPGTSILSLNPDHSGLDSPDHSQTQSRPSLSQTPTGSSSGSISAPVQKPTSTAIPPRTPGVRSSSVLTPPDEIVPSTAATAACHPPPAPGSTPVSVSAAAAQNRKRPLRDDQPTSSASPLPSTTFNPVQQSPMSPDKRRKTSDPNTIHPVPAPTPPAPTPPSSAGPSSSRSHPPPSSSLPATAITPPPSRLPPPVTTTAATTTATPDLGNHILAELLHAVQTRAAGPRWREEALDLFFRDFAHEALDLQVEISVGQLSDESKAMVFCKMPPRVRQHWVRRFRETHHRPA